MTRLDSRARQLLAYRDAAALAAVEEKRAKTERDEYESAFWSELEDLGLKNYTLDDGTRIDRRETTYSEVYDAEALFEWAKENGMFAEWFGQAPRKAALNEFVRTSMENSIELPPGLGPRVNRFLSVTKPPAKRPPA